MCEIRKKLPSYSKKNEILELIQNNQVILISGETGMSSQIISCVRLTFLYLLLKLICVNEMK